MVLVMDREAWSAAVHGVTKGQYMTEWLNWTEGGEERLQLPLSHLPSLLYQNIARRWPSVNQKKSCNHHPTMLTPWSWTSCLGNWEKINIHCLSPSVYGILLQQPELTETEGEEVREGAPTKELIQVQRGGGAGGAGFKRRGGKKQPELVLSARHLTNNGGGLVV